MWIIFLHCVDQAWKNSQYSNINRENNQHLKWSLVPTLALYIALSWNKLIYLQLQSIDENMLLHFTRNSKTWNWLIFIKINQNKLLMLSFLILYFINIPVIFFPPIADIEFYHSFYWWFPGHPMHVCFSMKCLVLKTYYLYRVQCHTKKFW